MRRQLGGSRDYSSQHWSSPCFAELPNETGRGQTWHPREWRCQLIVLWGLNHCLVKSTSSNEVFGELRLLRIVVGLLLPGWTIHIETNSSQVFQFFLQGGMDLGGQPTPVKCTKGDWSLWSQPGLCPQTDHPRAEQQLSASVFQDTGLRPVFVLSQDSLQPSSNSTSQNLGGSTIIKAITLYTR